MYVSGAKFEEHCSNISGDILIECCTVLVEPDLWRHHFPHLHNTKTYISLKRKKIFPKEKRHSSLHWKPFQISNYYFLLHRQFTTLIILPWTPEICLECLLCCNQSQMRSSHHRNHKQRTVSYRQRKKLFSFCLRNLKHRCSPRSALRTASSTSFEFRKKNFTSQRDATATNFQGSDITWR